MILLLAQYLLNVIFPIILGIMVTAVTSLYLHIFILALLGWAILALVKTIIIYFRERVEIKNFDYEMSQHLSKISLKKFFEISMGQHHLGHSIIKRNVITKGETSITGSIYISIYDLIPTIFSVLLPIIFIFTKVPIVGLSIVVAIIIFTVYTLNFNAHFVPRLRSLDTHYNTVGKQKGEFIHNSDVVFVNAQENRAQQESYEADLGISDEGKPLWLSYVKWFHAGQWFISFSQAICIGLLGYLTLTGHLTAGLFVTMAMWIQSALGSLTNISQIQRNLAKNIAPILKYFKFLDYEPDIKIPVNPLPVDKIKGKIEFRNVSFTYNPRKDEDESFNDKIQKTQEKVDEEDDETEEIPALKEISFILEAGKRYAFVGRSGAGKSTLVNLILRAFDPKSGDIFVDDINIKDLDYHELRKHIGLVPQDVSLFDETLKYNVAFGIDKSKEAISEDKLDQISRLSRINEFWDKLEKGWDTMIGERGIKLSGGQRQRVGIARALIKDPTILIFDEATSSLDTENEAKIRESIHEASEGKTTIIIAHRLATVRDANTIFVFDDGKIVGHGTHEELLQNNDFYKRLVQNQVIMA
jgi:ABC-type multidrug transport system fused ATPase/permease subunit